MAGNRWRWWAAGILGLFLMAVARQWPDDQVRLTMCEVGQGDAFIVSQKFAQVLIDGGPNNGKALACLGQKMPFWDRKIEMVIITHADSDHSGGMAGIIKRYRVGLLVVSDLESLSEKEPRIRQEVDKNRIKTVIARRGMKLTLNQMEWWVGWPLTDELETNLESVGLKLKVGQREAVLAGDLGVEAEEEMLAVNGWQGVEVIKVSHHGSKTSTSEVFLDKLRSKIALISVGKDDHYGHPHEEVMTRLDKRGIKVLRSDLGGTVTLIAGEEGWMVGK